MIAQSIYATEVHCSRDVARQNFVMKQDLNIDVKFHGQFHDFSSKSRNWTSNFMSATFFPSREIWRQYSCLRLFPGPEICREYFSSNLRVLSVTTHHENNFLSCHVTASSRLSLECRLEVWRQISGYLAYWKNNHGTICDQGKVADMKFYDFTTWGNVVKFSMNIDVNI